jgi:hypothetical protein
MNASGKGTGGVSIDSRLKSVSPSRYGMLKAWKDGEVCMLQQLWRGDALLAPFPAAMLGNVIHRVLDRLPAGAGEMEAGKIWDEESSHAESKLQNNWVTRGLLPLRKTVKGYTLKKILAIRGAAKFLASDGHPSFDGDTRTCLREEPLESRDKLFRGQADLLEKRGSDWILVDYKSGAVHEGDEESGEQRIKEGYVLQLRLYAHMVREAKGITISKAFLRTLDGQEIEVDVTETNVEAAANEARKLLDEFNSVVLDQPDSHLLAKPIPRSRSDGVFGCSGCLFRPACKVYKETEKNASAGKTWPRDAWGKVTSVKQVGTVVDLEIENENIVKDEQGLRIDQHLRISLRGGADRYPHLSEIMSGRFVAIYDYLKSRSSSIAQDGPRTCLYSVPINVAV